MYCWETIMLLRSNSCSSTAYRFKFPSVFIIFQTITVSVYAVFLLIGYTDKQALFCSSDDVIETLDNPTPFCTIIGWNLEYTVLAIYILKLTIKHFLASDLVEGLTELLPHAKL